MLKNMGFEPDSEAAQSGGNPTRRILYVTKLMPGSGALVARTGTPVSWLVQSFGKSEPWLRVFVNSESKSEFRGKNLSRIKNLVKIWTAGNLSEKKSEPFLKSEVHPKSETKKSEALKKSEWKIWDLKQKSEQKSEWTIWTKIWSLSEKSETPTKSEAKNLTQQNL